MILPRAFARHAITLVAIALVFVVVALLDRAITTPSPNAPPLWAIAVAGFGAAVVSTMLRRSGVRRQMPSPRRRAATPPGRAADAPTAFGQLAAARRRQRLAVGAWRRPLLGTIAALGAASLMLALVGRSPRSVPPLLSVGLTGILALRLLATSPRGITRAAAVATRPSVIPASAATRSGTHAPRPVGASSAAATVHSRVAVTPTTRSAATGGTSAAAVHEEARHVDRSRDGGWLDWTVDEVHDAALDSFPASDPPSWSTLRIGAPAAREPHVLAPA